MTASLFSGSLENLRFGVQDRLHQPYRFPMIAGAEQIFFAAYDIGAYAVCISGAGPSILSIVDASHAQTFVDLATTRLRDMGLDGWTVKLFSCDANGATVSFE